MSAADADDINKFGDSPDNSPPVKKARRHPKAKVVVELEADSYVEMPRIFRTIDREDPEYWTQRELFVEQYESSEGYEVEWEKFDYDFARIKFEWGGRFDVELSNKELLELLIQTAIDEINQDYGGEFEFVKYVSANVIAATGFCFRITMLLKDLSEPNSEPKLYRTLVRKFRDEIDVVEFKPRPTQ